MLGKAIETKCDRNSVYRKDLLHGISPYSKFILCIVGCSVNVSNTVECSVMKEMFWVDIIVPKWTCSILIIFVLP